MTPMESFIAHLTAQGYGALGTRIFAGNDNQLPDLSVAVPFQLIVNQTAGMQAIGTHNEGPVVIRRPHFQVVARAARYDTAGNAAESLVAACVVANLMIGDVFWLSMVPIGEPFKLTPDGQGKARVGLNIAGKVRR